MNKHFFFLTPLTFKYSNQRHVKRLISSLVRSSAELDVSVHNDIDNKNIKPRRHPGVITHAPVSLPDVIKRSITNLLSGEVPKKQMLKESLPLERYLFARKAPVEKKEYLAQREEIWNRVQNSMDVNVDVLSPEDKQRWNDIIRSKVETELKKKCYSWNRIDFTEYMSHLYLVTRSAAEYSVLYRIFKEIYDRSHFVPGTVFDFGSGMGSVIWAANSIWGNSVQEYYCVDSSSHINTLSAEIIKESNIVPTKNVFYRQFLPASYDITSDLVVSAYSLLELPSKEQRLETLTNLWNRTKKYLVLVEYGSRGGFKVLNEARKHILSQTKEADQDLKTSSIFAPCPHDSPCPREEAKCYFEAPYFSFPQKPEQLKKDFYSFVVFERGVKKNEDKQWPRIVQPVLRRSRHVICRLCCATGDLKEVIVTPSKHGKIAYRCAKASKWGDLFPYNLKPYEKSVYTKSKQNTESEVED